MVGVLKDSKVEWIGQVPNAWQEYRLENLVDNHFSGAWGNDEKGNELDRICMRIADFDYQKLQFQVKNVEDYTKRNYTKIEISKKTLKKGDILIEKSGGGEKTPVGRAVVYNLDNNALFANFMDCIRINDLSTPDFVKYYLFCSYCRGVTNLYFNQTTGIQNLNISRYLKESKVFLPDIDMQNDISSFLDEKCAEIDKLSEDIQKQIEILNDYKKSVITRAVTKGLDPNAEMKDSGDERLDMIPANWDAKKLKFVTREIYENGLMVPENDKYIGMENVLSYSNDFHETNTEYEISFQKKCKKGVVLFGKLRPYLAKVIICPFTGFATGEFMQLSNFDGDSRYLRYSLLNRTFIEFVNMSTYGAKMPRANSEYINNLKICIPPKDEQCKIADFLDNVCQKIDESIRLQQKQLSHLDTYKRSIIYEYVTGKKRVKGVL